jgi:hypothetical protein
MTMDKAKRKKGLNMLTDISSKISYKVEKSGKIGQF